MRERCVSGAPAASSVFSILIIGSPIGFWSWRLEDRKNVRLVYVGSLVEKLLNIRKRIHIKFDT